MHAEDLVRQYRMMPHEENGFYLERHFEAPAGARASSGSIYYYLGAEEASQFHVIDCDEYWVYVKGSPLEIWQLKPNGEIQKQLLGLGLGLEPAVHIPAGNIFGAKHLPKAEDGTFVVCITVPRFKYEGWKLLEQEELLEQWPEVKGFYE